MVERQIPEDAPVMLVYANGVSDVREYHLSDLGIESIADVLPRLKIFKALNGPSGKLFPEPVHDGLPTLNARYGRRTMAVSPNPVVGSLSPAQVEALKKAIKKVLAPASQPVSPVTHSSGQAETLGRAINRAITPLDPELAKRLAHKGTDDLETQRRRNRSAGRGGSGPSKKEKIIHRLP